MQSLLARGPGAAALVLLAGACATGSPRGVAATGGAMPTPIVVVTPAEPREQTADQQVQQVLNRLAFGARPGDVARVRAMGVDRWIALQLAPDRLDDQATDTVLASYELLGRPTRDFVTMYEEGQAALRKAQKQAATQGDSSAKRDLRAELLRGDPALRDRLRQNQRILGDVQSAKLARAVASERQLQEVMTDFWENHFTVFAGKGLTRLFIPAYDRDVIRPRAMGRFRDLLGAVAKSPAMLFFLDQWQSAGDSLHPLLAAGQPAYNRTRGLSADDVERMAPARRLTAEQRRRLEGLTPEQRAKLVQQRRRPAQRGRGLNENYARELLELHTLGVDGGYTQDDIINVARALTGWTMTPRQNAEFVFRPQIHDAGAKTVLGHTLAAGRGIEDGEEVLDILARDPHTARFIARKLAIRFVSDAPPAALVDRATDTFVRTDGDIREVVRTIVTSPEFFSRAAYRSKVKTPFELVASALRAMGAPADTSMRAAQAVALLGQPIFGHQAPNGWPETGEAWMNTGAILNRINFGLALAAGRLPGAGLAQWPDAARLRGTTRETQVDAVVNAFLGGQASPDTRDILLRGENPMAARLGAASGDSTARAEPMMQPDAMMPPNAASAPNGGPRRAAARGGLGQPVQLTGLAQIVGLAIGAPEFQRR
jgi:uncharacterized protein (DUF1800 family)